MNLLYSSLDIHRSVNDNGTEQRECEKYLAICAKSIKSQIQFVLSENNSLNDFRSSKSASAIYLSNS